MPRQKERNRLWEMIAQAGGVDEHEDRVRILRQRQELLEHWTEHPWNYLTGKDTDGRPMIWTKDEGDLLHPVKPFPAHLDYLRLYLDILMHENVVLVDKARQMMVTWVTLLYADWECRFHVARRCLLSKSTEDEAKEILRDKVRFSHHKLPDWFKKTSPLRDRPEIRCSYPKTGSYILAVAENVAEREARGGTASIVIVDEAARQREFESIMAASLPMATKIIAMTTAEVGNPGGKHFKTLIDEGKRVASMKVSGW